MKKLIFATLTMIATPAMSATLWNVITTDSTEKSLDKVPLKDPCGGSGKLNLYERMQDFCIGPQMWADVEVKFHGPGRTASKVTLEGYGGADATEAALVAKYGQPDSRDIVHPPHDGDHAVMRWRKDVEITFSRQLTGHLYDLTYERIDPDVSAAF